MIFSISQALGSWVAGGTPYAVQKCSSQFCLICHCKELYVIATLSGSLPSMFVTVALGSGIEKCY